MVFFTLEELVKWFGMTVFEIWLITVSTFVFSVLLICKIEGWLGASWWAVFSPLYIADALCAYFCVIVLIRMYHHKKEYKAIATRFMSSLSLLVCFFIFKFLYCIRLEGDENMSYARVYGPLFAVIHVITFKSCQVH